MTFLTPICSRCTHFHREDRTKDACDAFPEGIPEEIISGKNNHTTPVQGDHGIRFEVIPGMEDLLPEGVH